MTLETISFIVSSYGCARRVSASSIICPSALATIDLTHKIEADLGARRKVARLQELGLGEPVVLECVREVRYALLGLARGDVVVGTEVLEDLVLDPHELVADAAAREVRLGLQLRSVQVRHLGRLLVQLALPVLIPLAERQLLARAQDLAVPVVLGRGEQRVIVLLELQEVLQHLVV